MEENPDAIKSEKKTKVLYLLTVNTERESARTFVKKRTAVKEKGKKKGINNNNKKTEQVFCANFNIIG